MRRDLGCNFEGLICAEEKKNQTVIDPASEEFNLYKRDPKDHGRNTTKDRGQK